MNYRKMSKNIICKILSVCIAGVSTLIITNFVVTRISSEIYGFYQLSNDFVNYAMVISIALNSMTTRYISISFYKNNNKEVNLFFNSTIYANIILGVSLFIPLFILVCNLQNIIVIPDSYVSDVKILFLLMFINFVLSICTSVFSVATFMKNRIDLDSYRNIEGTLIRLLFLFVVYNAFVPRIWYLAVGALLSTLYVFLINLYYTKKLIPEVDIFNLKFLSIIHIKTLIKSGVWNSFTKVGAIFLNGLDLLIANVMIGSVAMGILSVSKTLPKLVFSSLTSLASVFTPSIMKEYAKEDKKGLVDTINESIKINSFFSIIISVIIIVLGKRIFDLWVPGQDGNTLHLLSVIAMLGYVILMPFEVLWSVFTITNKVKISSIYLTIESIFTLGTVFLLLNIADDVLIKMIIIAGTSTIYETIRGFFFLPLCSAKCLNIPFYTFYKPLVKVLISFFITLILSISLNCLVEPVGWIGLFVMCILISCISIIVSFYCVLNYKQRTMIKNKIRGLIKKGF